MADRHSNEQRSFNMSKVRSKDTKPEMLVRKFLFKNGYRYRLHDKKLPGKPDIVFPKYKIVVFINGCFWHGHEKCKYFSIPKTNSDWWISKIEKNKQRDIFNNKELVKQNWSIITIFGCELKKHNVGKTLNRLIDELKILTLSS
jgi:DNA mismatch endonuclease (patch repair protein)